MCGRAAQSVSVVEAAAMDLGITVDFDILQVSPAVAADASAVEGTANEIGSESLQAQQSSESQLRSDKIDRNNYNMSPGMDAVIFWKKNSNNCDGQYQMSRMTWGLVPRGGTSADPLPQGMGKHFNSLMFNARSDTLFSKPTFTGLANSGQSCIIAVDGFFEWKTEMGQKQPYFVYRNNSESNQHQYLLLAGLWKRGQTGWLEQPVLDTFTIITTEVCEPLKWLHTRMPITVWDMNLAKTWLDRPSSSTHAELDRAAQHSRLDLFQWHAVTPAMSSMKFRSIDAIKPMRKQKTVKSFFTNSASESSKAKKSQACTEGSANKLPTKSPLPKVPPVISNMNSSSPMDTQTRIRNQKREATPQPVTKGTSASKKLKVASPGRTIDSFFGVKAKPNSSKKGI
jgi:putative SOS response-associated peptidase YedK